MSNTTSRSHTPNSEPRSPKLEEDENGEGVDGEDGYESVDEKPKSGRAIDLWADDEDVKKDEEIEDGSLGGEGDTEDMGVIMHGTRRSSSHQVEMSRSPSTQGLKPSLSSTSSSSSSSSSSSTPHTKPNSRKRTPPPSSSSANLSKKPKKPEPQLIGDLPRAEEAALKSFVEIEGNHYQYGTLGRSREALESMTCDCQYEHGVDHRRDACGDGSDCINRLTQVECLPDDCRCRSYCQNQRFQRREYAPIEIVLTEKKGFGLRAAADLTKDTFIYEYVGDVVSQPSFLKRMRLYAEEGIRHFYFMMLQKDEFIDATKRGGIGRFANHSCNPNCFVAKWTVGDHVRMGIFANRYIRKNEELTFNYNVDRYGHDAQPCYCGEPNCVGFIGGKTQTDFAAMDDMYFEALGITDEEEKMGLKGNKKKKGKKLDDEDFVPNLKPLLVKEVPKFLGAMRQTTSRKMLHKLLTRLKMTEDQTTLREFMRLRGFSAMTNLLEDNKDHEEISVLALESLLTMPLIHRNKVEDSKIEVPVRGFLECQIEKLVELAQKALDYWATLEVRQKIKKRSKEDGDESISFTLYDDDPESPPPKRSRRSESPRPRINVKPLGFTAFAAPPRMRIPLMGYIPPAPPPPRRRSTGPSKASIAAVISAAAKAKIEDDAKAAAAAEAKAKAEAEAAAAKAAKAGSSSSSRRSKHKKLSREEREAAKEKQLLKLIGAVVVKCMSKYRDKMDHDQFKSYAKELTSLIAEKEKKSKSYQENKLESLSEEKTVKIKKFAKEYIHKILRKLDKNKKPKSSSSHRQLYPSASASTSTPGQNDMDGLEEGPFLPEMSLEDTMDIDEMVRIVIGAERGDGGEDDESAHHPSPDESLDAGEPDQTPASTSSSRAMSDPRARHRNEESGWDPSSHRISIPFKARAKALRGC